MGAAKEFLDKAAVLVIFVAACYFSLNAFLGLGALQDALNGSISGKGVELMQEAYPEARMQGEELIALLLFPEGLAGVVVDGEAFALKQIEEATARIMPGVPYAVSRMQAEDGAGVHLKLTAVLP